MLAQTIDNNNEKNVFFPFSFITSDRKRTIEPHLTYLHQPSREHGWIETRRDRYKSEFKWVDALHSLHFHHRHRRFPDHFPLPPSNLQFVLLTRRQVNLLGAKERTKRKCRFR